MKKTALVLALAIAFVCTSCEGLLQQIVSSFLGNATVTLTDEEGSQNIDLSCCLCNTVTDTMHHTLMVAANVDLSQENVAVTMPYLILNVTDTAVGIYPLSTLTLGLFREHDTFSAETLLGLLNEYSLMLIAENDSSWYVSADGIVEITEYPALNQEVKGTVSGTMIHVTQSEVDAIEQVRDALREEIRGILLSEGYSDEDDLDELITERLRQLPITRVFPNAKNVSVSFSSVRMERDLVKLIGQEQ